MNNININKIVEVIGKILLGILALIFLVATFIAVTNSFDISDENGFRGLAGSLLPIFAAFLIYYLSKNKVILFFQQLNVQQVLIISFVISILFFIAIDTLEFRLGMVEFFYSTIFVMNLIAIFGLFSNTSNTNSPISKSVVWAYASLIAMLLYTFIMGMPGL